MSTYSVLASVYKKDSPEKLVRCLDSVLNQDFLVNEVMLVEDGPLTEELARIISTYPEKFGQKNIIFKSIALHENQGLPKALNKGLEAIKTDWIFRIDSDDICLPGRFKKQIEAQQLTQADILGGRIQEFTENRIGSLDKQGERCIQLGMINNKRGYFFRNPVNHMTVLYRKSDIQQLGGYKDLKGFEDYELWLRAINSGYMIYNVNEALCRVDIEGLLCRRSGYGYLKNEAAFFFYCFKNYKGKIFFLISFLIRFWTRLLPHRALEYIYTSLTRK